MDIDEDSFVSSRASLQSRRQRLAKRSEQNALEAQRSGLAEPSCEAVVSSLLDGLPEASADGDGQVSRTRRHSDTRSGTSDGTSGSRADGSGRICRDREYVQPKIEDQCDDVALSLIQSSSILSMEEQGSHSRGRILSGEGNMASLRRTMPARMRASTAGERNLLDTPTSAAESPSSLMVRRTSVDCVAKVPNGESKADTPPLRRQSSLSSGSAGNETKAQLGWMPGNSVLTSRPVLATVAADDLASARERRPPERTPSDESREERIARYKEQRRRSKVLCNGSEERETSGPVDADVVHKRWHSLDDQEQHQQQAGLRRGSSVFFDARRQSTEECAHQPLASSSASDQSFDAAVTGRKRDLTASKSEEPLAPRPAALKLEHPPAGAYLSDATAAAQLLPTSLGSTVGDGQQPKQAATPDGKNPDLPGSANARRNSRRRRSNMHLDAEQPEVTPTLHEVPAEAEAADTSLASTGVVTRPRRRRPTDKSETADTATRDSFDTDSSQALSKQWQHLTASVPVAAPDSRAKEVVTPDRRSNTAVPDVDQNGKQKCTVVLPSDGSPEKRISGVGVHADDTASCNLLKQPSDVLGAPVAGANTTASDSEHATVAARSTEACSLAGRYLPNGIPHEEGKSRGDQVASGLPWKADETACQAVPAAVPAAETRNGAGKLRADPEQEAIPEKTVPSLPGANGATSAEAKDSESCILDTVPGVDGAGVRAVITQNKSRSEKKAAALGLILQKFEVAGSGLPPAVAAAIGLPSPTSATAPPPKKVPSAKTGKVENVIKQMASHQLEPTTGAHQPDKTQAHPSASVGSLVRKFAGTGSPPASLHVSLLSSTDGACSDTTTASKSTSPVRPASPASLVDVSTRDAHRPGSDRAPSPKITGYGHPATSTLSSHSSPASQRRSPVIVSRAMSPNGMQMTSGVDAFRATDSDASSQLTDDGQHPDSAGGHRTAAPVIKPPLQSPTKLQNQQPYFFSTTGKKPFKTGSSPVTPVVGSTQIATESSTEAGGEYDERHIGDLCLQKEMVGGEAAMTVAVAAELPADRFSPPMQADVCDRARQEYHDAGAGNRVRARCSASSDGFADPTAAAATTAPDSSIVPVSAEHDRMQPASPDGHVKDMHQPQPFAKLRAAPTTTKSAAKSEQQQLLDPQLANILQARLKKVETKPMARLSGATTAHDDYKPVSKEETVDRATQSIKDKTLYFMQMQQKLQNGGDAALVPPSRVLAPPGQVSQQLPSARTVGTTSAGSNGRTGQGKEQQSGPAISAVAAPSPPEQAPAQQRKERRRMRSRRRGSLSGDERDRWQTQPVTDSEVLVAAAVVVRGQTMTGSSDCPQPESSSLLVTPAAAQPGNTAGMDEVRRLAVMTLEEKIGLFMDRSVAWACYDPDAAPTSPDRSIRHLPIDHRAAATHCRRAAWRGRFSTQPVSQKELRRALSMLGSSALAPPTALDAAFNQKIAQLCDETEMKRQAAIQPTEITSSKQKHGNERTSTRRSSGNKKSSDKAEAVVSSPHGSREIQHHGSIAREAGSNAIDKRGQRTSRSSAGGTRQRPNSMHAEPAPLVDAPNHNGNEMSRNASLRQSGCAPKMRSKVTDKPAKQRPVSMNGEVNVPNLNMAGHASPSLAVPNHDSGDAVHNASPVVRLRPRSAKASLATQNKVRGSSEAKADVVAAGHGDRAATRSLSIQDGEGKIAVSLGTTTGHKGHHVSKAGLTKDRDTHGREQETAVTEPLTKADKSKSQPCISTISDSLPADDLPSYMRATTSYVRKVEHLLAESDEDDDDDRVADDDRSSLDGSKRETNHTSPFQRAGTELNANRASVRRTLGPRASTGGQLESPVSPHNGGEPTYMRATKAMSMRDIRTPGNKTPQHADDQTAIGTKIKRRSVDGSRNSLPARPSSAAQLHGSAMDRSSSDDDDLPSYMRATKSFARKVEHLIESCDEDENGNDETMAAARLDECSDEGEHGSSARSPTARRSRTPSTHGGSDLTPSDLVMQEGKSTESQGSRERQPAHKVASKRTTPSKNGSSASLNQEGSGHPTPSQCSISAVQHKPHGSGKSGSSASQVPVVDGKRHKAAAATGASVRDTVHAEAENTHGTKIDADPGKAKRRSKDKHALIGGDLPSFMRATKSSLTKDRHLVDAAEQEHNSADDHDKTVKTSQQPARKPHPQHPRGQGSRESLSSLGAGSSKADSGHLSSSESAEHAGHTAPIPLISLSDTHVTQKQGKLPSRISNNGGMLARHSKQHIGAVGGSAG